MTRVFSQALFPLSPLPVPSPSLELSLSVSFYFPENQFEERGRGKNESARNPGINPKACALGPLLIPFRFP